MPSITYLQGASYAKMPKIALDQPRRPFRPGDVISGIIQDAGQGPFRRAVISLEGRAKVKITETRSSGPNGGRRRHVYRSRVLLCAQQQSVSLDEDGHLRFEVPLPSKAFDLTGAEYRTAYWDNQWNVSTVFAGSDVHNLPPTMNGTCYSMMGGKQAEMYIEYKLTAHITPEAGVSSSSSPCTFWVAGPSPSDQQLQPYLSPTLAKTSTGVKTLKLIPEYSERALTFRETLKNTFSSKVPELQFATTISVPRFVYTGQPMKLELSVAAPRSNGIGPAEADVSISHLTLEFKRILECRAKTTFSQIQRSDSGTVLHERVIGPQNPQLFGPSHGGFEQVKTLLTSPIKLAPSFSTCNVHRSYGLSIKATLVCAGEVKSMSQAAAVRVFSSPTGLPSYGAVMNGTDGVEEIAEDWGPCPKFKEDDD